MLSHLCYSLGLGGCLEQVSSHCFWLAVNFSTFEVSKIWRMILQGSRATVRWGSQLVVNMKWIAQWRPSAKNLTGDKGKSLCRFKFVFFDTLGDIVGNILWSWFLYYSFAHNLWDKESVLEANLANSSIQVLRWTVETLFIVRNIIIFQRNSFVLYHFYECPDKVVPIQSGAHCFEHASIHLTLRWSDDVE